MPNGKKSVRIKLTGIAHQDEALTTKAAGFANTKPSSQYTWHHLEDGATMQLVPVDCI